MNDYELNCPKCDNEIEASFLEDVSCENCGFDKFFWDSYFAYGRDGEIEDEIFFVNWEE